MSYHVHGRVRKSFPIYIYIYISSVTYWATPTTTITITTTTTATTATTNTTTYNIYIYIYICMVDYFCPRPVESHEPDHEHKETRGTCEVIISFTDIQDP